MPTQIIACTCQHEFQDKRYGKGNRVYNVNDKNGRAKCTVCGTRTQLHFTEVKETKKNK